MPVENYVLYRYQGKMFPKKSTVWPVLDLGGGGGYFLDSIYSFNNQYLVWNQYPFNKCSDTAE